MQHKNQPKCTSQKHQSQVLLSQIDPEPSGSNPRRHNPQISSLLPQQRDSARNQTGAQGIKRGVLMKEGPNLSAISAETSMAAQQPKDQKPKLNRRRRRNTQKESHGFFGSIKRGDGGSLKRRRGRAPDTAIANGPRRSTQAAGAYCVVAAGPGAPHVAQARES